MGWQLNIAWVVYWPGIVKDFHVLSCWTQITEKILSFVFKFKCLTSNIMLFLMTLLIAVALHDCLAVSAPTTTASKPCVCFEWDSSVKGREFAHLSDWAVCCFLCCWLPLLLQCPKLVLCSTAQASRDPAYIWEQRNSKSLLSLCMVKNGFLALSCSHCTGPSAVWVPLSFSLWIATERVLLSLEKLDKDAELLNTKEKGWLLDYSELILLSFSLF